eukprot:gene29129-35157_t
MSEKNDVFVGNLGHNTTEEQLRQVFSFVGPIKSVRILVDRDTGRQKGFAFVEYYDTNTALAAIKHLDQTELNNRRIKVGFPTQNSGLKDIARQIGQIGPEADAVVSIQNIVDNLKLHEAWDLLECMKNLLSDERRANRVKEVLEQQPQLIAAMYEIQKRLGIVLPAHIQQHQARLASIQANAGQPAAAGGMGIPPPPVPPSFPPPPQFVPPPLFVPPPAQGFYDQGPAGTDYYDQGAGDMRMPPMDAYGYDERDRDRGYEDFNYDYREHRGGNFSGRDRDNGRDRGYYY